MDQESQIRILVQQALDSVAPPAPWLTARVMGALKEEAAGRRRGIGMRIAGHRLTAVAAGGIAVVLVVVALTAVLIGPRLLARSQPQPRPAATPASSPSDRGLLSYQQLVLRDGAGIPATGSSGPCDTGLDASRASGFAQCRADSLAVKAAAQKYRDDLNATKPPQQLSGQHSRLMASLQALIGVLDERVAAIDSNSVESLGAANTKVNQQIVGGVDEVEAEIRCSPAKVGPVPEGGYTPPCVRS